MDVYILLLVIGSIYVTGRIAERRGRSFKVWAYTAGIILGPFAIPLLLLLPNLHAKTAALRNGA